MTTPTIEQIELLIREGNYNGVLEYCESFKPQNNDEILEIIRLKAYAYWRLGDRVKSYPLFEELLLKAQELGLEKFEAMALHYMGTSHIEENSPTGILYLKNALRLRRKIGDEVGEAATLNNLGSSYLALGQFTQALRYLQESLTIENWGAVGSLAIGWLNIANIYRLQGKEYLAIYKRSLELAQKDQHFYVLVASHLEIARHYLLYNEITEALNHLKMAGELLSKTSEVSLLVLQYHMSLTQALVEEGNFDQARINFKDGLRCYNAMKAKNGLTSDAKILMESTLAWIKSRAGKFDQSKGHWERLLSESELSNNLEFKITSRLELAALELKEPSQAVEITTEAFELASQHKVLRACATSLMTMMLRDRRLISDQIELLRRSRELLSIAKDERSLEQATEYVKHLKDQLAYANLDLSTELEMEDVSSE